MSAPYGSLMRYLFPALLLHGESGAGAAAWGGLRPLGDYSWRAREAGWAAGVGP